jgi:cyclophilin family peptidyl-prolyl cis-trans isomerase
MRILCLSALLSLATLLFVSCLQAPAEKKAYTPAEGAAEKGPAMVAEGTPPDSDTETAPSSQTKEETETSLETESADSSAEEEDSTEEAASQPEPPDETQEDKEADETAEEEEAADDGSADTEEQQEKIPASQLLSRMRRIVQAMFETSKGSFIVAIYPEIAPISAPHFTMLIREGFYNGMRIHRYEPGYVVQLGKAFDSNGNPLYPDDPKKAELAQITIDDEPCLSENTDMTISFAKPDAPDSASCQFFVNLGDNRKLDDLNYGFTVMAQVIHGQDVVRRLRVGDTIGNAQIIEPGSGPGR